MWALDEDMTEQWHVLDTTAQHGGIQFAGGSSRDSSLVLVSLDFIWN